MKKIVFTEDFATKKKGDKWECDSLLASQMVHNDKVAKYEADENQEADDTKSKALKTKKQ